MKLLYDPTTDILMITLADAPVAHGDEFHPGVVADFDAADRIVSFEIFDFVKKYGAFGRVEFGLENPDLESAMAQLREHYPQRFPRAEAAE